MAKTKVFHQSASFTTEAEAREFAAALLTRGIKSRVSEPGTGRWWVFYVVVAAVPQTARRRPGGPMRGFYNRHED
jgi:hypothetical protein